MSNYVQVDDWVADFRVYTGQSGTGKTYLATHTLKRERARWKFIYDHKGGQIAHMLGLRPVYDGDELMQAVAVGGPVCFNPERLFAGRLHEGFQFFCAFAWSIGKNYKGRKILFVDELQNVVDPRKVTREFQEILDAGRSYQFDMLLISSRPNAIHNYSRDRFTKVFAFRQIDENATAFLKFAGIDEKAVRNLRNGEHLWRDIATGQGGKGGKAF